MLIPSIDLRSGKVVQLIQGERLAIEQDDVFAWVSRFQGFPRVQLIDLDAALGQGTNDDLIRRVCSVLPCRVGGGIRSIEAARQRLLDGACQVIVGSALFNKDGLPDISFASRLAEAVGAERVIAAVDSRGGHVVVHGWRTGLPVTPVNAMGALAPYCGEFLYTHVDTEGLLQGIDMDAVQTIRAATTRRISAAGGITTQEEIRRLDRMGIDSVVGMAIYTGLLTLDPSSPSM
jgi:phosphoribosylformimino-5-aminoimidazole carboxamide ribotide isomerase